MLKISVCIKQVPAISEVRIDPKTGLLKREGIPGMINPVDKNAIELALNFKEKFGSIVYILSMGPPQAEDALREALAMGADHAYLLTDKRFAGADTLSTSYTLGLAIKKVLEEEADKENYLVICGSQTIDGDTAQVGPQLAEELQIPHFTFIQNAELKDNKIIVEKLIKNDLIMKAECKLPVLITITNEINIPRFATLSGIVDAFDNKKIIVLNADDLNPDLNKIGINGSMTEVWKIFLPEQKGEYIKLSGTIESVVRELYDKLKEEKVI